MRKIFAPLIVSFVLTNFTFAQRALDLQAIWNFQFQPKAEADFHSMPDGEHYCKLELNHYSGQDIVEYSYKTGKAADTILRGSDLISASGKTFPFDDYTLSADAKKVLLSTQTQAVYRRSTVSNFFVYDILTKKITALSMRSKQQNAVFSPDGNKVAFVRDNNIYIKNLGNDSEMQVTNDGKKNFIINGQTDWVYEEEFEFTVAFQWSPDSKKLAYYRFDESHVPEYTVQFFNDQYPENYIYKYPKVGQPNSVVSIYIFDLENKNRVLCDIGKDTDQYIPKIQWTKDPDRLCIFRMNRLQNHLDFLMARASDGRTEIFYSEENKKFIDINMDYDITFFNNNQNFIWCSEMDGWNHIYNISTKTGQLVNKITLGNYDVTKFYGLDEKNSRIYYQSAELSPMQRYIYSIKSDGSDKKILMQLTGTNDADFSSTYSYFLQTHSDINNPPDYEICDSKGTIIRQLEDNEALKDTLKEYHLSIVNFFDFPLEDGTKLNGWMIKPAHFDSTKKYPVMMFAYGGPNSQEVLNEWKGDNFLQYEYWAQHGYIVACVDNRGTGARGEAFRKITYLQLGKYETDDQVAAAKYVGSLSFADKTRIGFFGWSYGGYMALNCFEQAQDVFKTVVAVAPVTDWRFYDSIYTERYMQTDQTNKAGYDANSPLLHADMIHKNFLLAHGLSDDNVHYQNSAMLMDALYQNNVPFTQLTFPNKNHGIGGGITRYYLFTRISDFIFENL